MTIPRTSHPTADLLSAARAGDSSAFDRLFAGLVHRLRWYVVLRLGDGLKAAVEVDDVLQETFVAAWESLDGFQDRGRGSLLRWFFALAENRIRSLANARQALRRDDRRTVGGGAADAALAMEVDPRTGPSTFAARAELRGRLAIVIGELDADEQSALLGRLVDERPWAEVAGDLGCSESAARRLVSKAAAKVGAALEQGGQA